MKFVIISDTHDNISNLKKTLSWLKKEGIKEMIHCGDLCTPAFLTKILAPGFDGQIHLIHGNVGDRKLLAEKSREFKNVKLYGDFGEMTIQEKKIAFVHQPTEAKKLAETQKYDLVFYGHTHKPWLKKMKINIASLSGSRSRLAKPRQFVLLVNPGNLAGMFYKATFAVYDTKTDKLELKILDFI